MEGSRRRRRIGRLLAKGLVLLCAGLLLVVVGAVVLVETDWTKDQLRALVVRQANQYLTAELAIGRLEGSLYTGIQLRDVRLSRGGDTLVAIDRVALSYSLAELYRDGLVLRRLDLVRPRIVAAREDDGRWNLAALVRRQAPSGEPRGTPRPIAIRSIEVTDGQVVVQDPLVFGAAHLPTRFDDLNASLSFEYAARSWNLAFTRLSWIGHAPDLALESLSGTIAVSPTGWSFEDLNVRTPRSAYVVDGRVDRSATPASIDLEVKATRFAFQEWAGIIPGLRRLAVEAEFDVAMNGPVNSLTTDIGLRSTGGDVDGSLVLDTTVPGWHARGSVDTNRVDLARWLDQPDRPSDITGQVDFDLDLDLGRHFPRGTYAFDGPRARYLGYEADNVRARGTITASEVVIAEAIATAYGANLRVSAGTIGIDSPFPFQFQGTAHRVDLRRVPATIPVPHVETTLAFDYDVAGRFRLPYLAGRAVLGPSEFLGASIEAGTIGTLDTSTTPVRYSGEGGVSGLVLERLASELEIEWLAAPRYRGTVSGHFRAEGTGGEPGARRLSGAGRIARADLFGGTLSNAQVAISLQDGSLTAWYDGLLAGVDPAIALTDERFAASLSGSAQMRVFVRDLLIRSPVLDDYVLNGRVQLNDSTARGVEIDAATIAGSLSNGTLTVDHLQAAGPLIKGEGKGTIGLAAQGTSDFQYDISYAALSLVGTFLEADIQGRVATRGRLTGPLTAFRVQGTATANDVVTTDVRVATVTGEYDATIPADRAQATATVNGRAGFVEAFGEAIDELSGTVTHAGRLTNVDLHAVRQNGQRASIRGSAQLDLEGRSVELDELGLGIEELAWRLIPAVPRPTLTWNESGIAVTPMQFTDAASGRQRLGVAGDWRQDGSGALHVTAAQVSLETLTAASARAAPYGGVLDLDATISGTRARPIVTGHVSITNGRVRQLSYEQLSGRVEYIGGMFEIGMRLDQSPGVWLTASGAVPLGLIDPQQPERPMHVAIASTPISLGLIEGITGIVRDVSGQVELSVSAVGTSHHPRFTGSVRLADAGFVVTSTGARYSGGSGVVELRTERMTVDAFEIRDSAGQSLTVSGTVGTSELRLEDLELEVAARGFEVLRNEFGTTSVDARVGLRGRVESPTVTGNVTITGGQLRVDRILDRVLFQPYTLAADPSQVPIDAIAALNPWDRLELDVALHVPGTLRMIGDNLQVASGTPLGVGDIDLRVSGDLLLRKGRAQPLSVTGSLDQITGRYSFQGRRFDLDPISSITFRGDLNPELFVTVRRVISGVETRVTIAGSLSEPELRLSSVPPLDSSDILSLIVFNSSANQLSAAQQEELAVRAGTLAAGFLVSPLISAIERSLGIDMLEIEAAGSGGTRVTIGDEIAPGLVARFSRQFGADEYDEATIEYYLSRLFRIRATFSDAGSAVRSPFRRVERAGVDLLLFFSF
jgi:translocation and assembly module TamB